MSQDVLDSLLDDTQDDPIRVARHRNYAILAVMAGSCGLLSGFANAVQGHLSVVELCVGNGISLACVAAPFLAYRFERYRQGIMATTIVLMLLTMIGLVLHFGLLITSPTLFLLLMTPATTHIMGVRFGFFVALASMACFVWVYFIHHHGTGTLAVGGSFIDWGIVCFSLCLSSAVLFVGAAVYRHQMSRAVRLSELARQRAEVSERAKSDFLADMSHEIRTPMNGVLGMIDVCLASELPAEQRENLEVARNSARSLIRVLSDILDVSKLEQGALDVERVPFDARVLLQNTVTLFSAAAQAKAIALHVQGLDNLPPALLIDPDRVSQILSNLLANAVKFTDQGEVTVITDYRGSKLYLSVKDTGCGMPEEFLADVFQRFRQARNGLSERRGGTGLGLSICYELCHLMDGEIQVESTLGAGSRFDVVIPAQAPKAEPTPAPPAQETVKVDPGRPLSLLIAEDNPVNVKVVAAFLAKLGHHFAVAVNGREAIDMAQTGDFDLILMDVSMPEVDGIEATRIIRTSNGPNSSVPVIMLTAHVEARIVETALAVGAQDVLHKPLNFAALEACLARHTAAKSDQDAEAS